MNPIALIPARLGSKRLPNKNWLMIGGMTLIARAIDHAMKAGFKPSDIFLTTDDSTGGALACRRILRPPELARDDTPMMPVVRHACKFLTEDIGIEFDSVVLLQPTSPLRRPEDIRATIDKLGATGGDVAMTVVETHEQEIWQIGHAGRLRTLANPAPIGRTVVPNGAVFAITTNALKDGYGFEDAPLIYGVEMEPWCSIDINTAEDFETARLIIERTP